MTRPRRRLAPGLPSRRLRRLATTPLRSTRGHGRSLRPRLLPGPEKLHGPGRRSGLDRGTCLDVAGNAATPSLTLKMRRDRTADNCDADRVRPTRTAGTTRQSRSASPEPTPTAVVACARHRRRTRARTARSPQSSEAARTGPGTRARRRFGLRYGAPPPQTTATQDGLPTRTAWYRAPLGQRFAGLDATTGIGPATAQEACRPRQRGPQSAAPAATWRATAQLAPSCSGTTRRRPR